MTSSDESSSLGSRTFTSGGRVARDRPWFVPTRVSDRETTGLQTQRRDRPRTVEWHLRKVFMKFGITSRRELTAALQSA